MSLLSLSYPYFQRKQACLFLTAVAALWGSSAWAGSLDPISRQFRSANMLGRGDAGLASATGTDAVFYNPAGLAQPQENSVDVSLVGLQAEASPNVRSLYNNKDSAYDAINQIVSDSSNPYYAAIQNNTGLIVKNFAIGAVGRAELLAMSSGSTIDSATAEIDTVGHYGGYVAFGENLFHNFYLGTTLKFLQKKEANINLTLQSAASLSADESFRTLIQDNTSTGNGFGADVGGIIVFDQESRTQIGFDLQNIGNMKYSWSIPSNGTSPSDDLQSLNVGATTSFGTSKSRVKLYGDFYDATNRAQQATIKRIHAGAEYNLMNALQLMAGYNEGYLSYGASVNIKIIKIEAGMYSEDVGSSSSRIENQRYYARASVGWLM